MIDLVIREGEVIDGTGRPPFRADVGIDGGRIVAVGRVGERSLEELSAEGHYVTPGFIDPHTHLDAQVCWDPLGTSSCWHGVTSVIMGNCGFTLAPSRSGERDLVLRNLERAEEISRSALLAGVDFRWETFPEYLEALEELPKGINFGGYVGHSAIRTYVMGERAFDEPPTGEDLEAMRRQVRLSVRAGAFGLSTTRSPFHHTSDDRPVASCAAGWEELAELAGVMGALGVGLVQMSNARFAGDPEGLARYLERLRALARSSGRPLTCQIPSLDSEPGSWARYLALAETIAADGGRMYCQAHSRELLNVLGFRVSLPYDKLPGWRQLRQASLAGQRAALLDPATRGPLVDEAMAALRGPDRLHGGPVALGGDQDLLAIVDGGAGPYQRVADVAAAAGSTPVDVVIDRSLETNFEQLFAAPIANKNLDDVLTALRHPHSVVAASDSGAHVTSIMDASVPTHLLAYWVRHRQAFSWEEGICMLTGTPAAAWGLADRGLIRTGCAADVNVLDPEHLSPQAPRAVADLPGGAGRLVQGADGIKATLVNGTVVLRDGVHTGAYPGQVLRAAAAGGGGRSRPTHRAH